jgi:hypothetical protein
MDPAENSFIRKVFIKSFSEKSALPPSCKSPLKIPHHLKQLLAIRKRIPLVGMKFIAPLSTTAE